MWCVFSMLSMGFGMGKNPIDGPGSSDSAFGMANWAVLILYFAVLMGMGIYFVRREKGVDDFFKGGGRIPWWAAGMSIYATMISAIAGIIIIPLFT